MSSDDFKHESIPLHEGKPVSTEFRTKIDTDPYLVIEVVKESFYDQPPSKLDVGYDEKNNISTKKIISINRWKHIKFFIFIQPSAEQLYVASNLRMPHYQMKQDNLRKFKYIATNQCGFNDRVTDGDFRVLSNDKNHHRLIHESFNDLKERDTLRYITVLNRFSGDDVDDGVIRLYQFLQAIPTEIIANLVYARRLVIDHRGNIYFDWGESGKRNCGRQKHYGSGCPFPRGRSIVPELSQDEEEIILDALEKLSMIFTDDQFRHFIPGDVATGEECFSHPKGIRESFRKVLKLDKKFGKKYSGIVYPRARFHYTGGDSLVQCHCDWENALRVLSAFVASFCRYVQCPSSDGNTPTIRRTGFHGYGCQALENCQERYNKIQPYIEEVSKFYKNELGFDRKVVDEHLFTKRVDKQWLRFEPHVSKIVGLSCFADSIIRFSHRCKSEISIRTYLGLCFNTIACEYPDSFINYLDKSVSCDADDDLMAWSMYRHMMGTKNDKKQNNNVINEKRRMHQPTHNSAITKEQYNKNIEVLLLVVQYYIFEEVKDEYQNHSLALSVMVQKVFGCGELLSHHVLFVMSLIGLVPDCVCSYAEFASTTGTSKYLDERFHLFDKDEYVECSYHALKALATYLDESMMVAENVTCKWVQFVKRTNGRWRYSISPEQQFIFHYDALSGKIVMYSKEGIVNRIKINFDLDSIDASNELKKVKRNKKCLKKKQAWKGKKRPPTSNVIKVEMIERQATKLKQVLRTSGIGDGLIMNSQAIQRMNMDYCSINMSLVIGRFILLQDKPISDTDNYVFAQLKQSGTFISSKLNSRYKDWWTVSLKHDPLVDTNKEPWSIRHSFNPAEIKSKLVFPAGNISTLDYYEHNGMFYFNIRAKAKNFINLCAFLYLDQERTYDYLLKRFQNKYKNKETEHNGDLSFEAGCYMFLKLEDNKILKNYYEKKMKNKQSNNGSIIKKQKQQNIQDLSLRDEVFFPITGARPPLLVVFDNIGVGRKLRGFHLYLLRYTDFALDRIQVYSEKSVFITSDYSVELLDVILTESILNTNNTSEETKEECENPFGLYNDPTCLPPLEYEQSKRSYEKI